MLVTPEIEKAGLEEDTPDNALIRLAYSLVRKGERVIIVSMDINVRVKANALDLETEDFEHEKKSTSTDCTAAMLKPSCRKRSSSASTRARFSPRVPQSVTPTCSST